MTAFLALAANDLRLQFRSGIHAAYGVVLALYLAVLAGLGAALPNWAVAVIVFTDPAALGFFFLGALLMLERSENVRPALAMTLMTTPSYLAAKTVTLTALALVATLALGLSHASRTDFVLLLVAVTLTSIQFIGIGVPIGLVFRTVTGYVMGSALFLTPVILPAAFAFLESMPAWLLLVPTVSQFRLMLAATGAVPVDPFEVGVALVVSGLAASGAYWLATAALKREFGR